MKNILYYPNAINWMWGYCINLGKFIDSKGNNWDLGIMILEGEGPWSAACVFSDEEGSYISGSEFMYKDRDNNSDYIKEMIKRAKNLGLITFEYKTKEETYKELFPEYDRYIHIETGWDCKESPIERCLWNSETDPEDYEQCCMFCGKPEERK